MNNNERQAGATADSSTQPIGRTSATLAQKPVLAAVLRFFNPNYSYCEKCKIPWNYCKSKSVYTDKRSGTFATCQTCWDNSTLEQLKKYYTRVYNKQVNSLIGSGHKMEHSLEHLLKCVEQEYARTHGS